MMRFGLTPGTTVSFSSLKTTIFIRKLFSMGHRLKLCGWLSETRVRLLLPKHFVIIARHFMRLLLGPTRACWCLSYHAPADNG